MNDEEKKLLLDHEYDGIQEFDNPLPNWWLITFYATIVFSVFYIYYYHIGSGPTSSQELEADLKVAREGQAKQNQAVMDISEDMLLAMVNDPAAVSAGQKVFATSCASCHGQKGEGGIGPNLTDNAWVHGKGTMKENISVINDGVLEKGMPPWKGVVSAESVKNLVVYIKSIEGTNPANAKAPQGTEY